VDFRLRILDFGFWILDCGFANIFSGIIAGGAKIMVVGYLLFNGYQYFNSDTKCIPLPKPATSTWHLINRSSGQLIFD
jgi:hypothetical protein